MVQGASQGHQGIDQQNQGKQQAKGNPQVTSVGRKPPVASAHVLSTTMSVARVSPLLGSNDLDPISPTPGAWHALAHTGPSQSWCSTPVPPLVKPTGIFTLTLGVTALDANRQVAPGN